MSSQITFVGLGNMGTALAQAHLNTGKTITVWNRNPNRPSVSTLVNAGAKFEPSLEAALAASPVTVICLLDHDSIFSALKPLCAAPGGLSKVRTIVNVTNGTAKDARKMDKWVREQGAKKYISGAIMTAPYMIGQEGAFVFCSGEDEAFFNEIRYVIEPWGTAEYFGEDPGEASLYDVALLAGMYGMFAGALTGMSLMRRGKPWKGHDRVLVEQGVKKYMNPLLFAFVPMHERIAQCIDTNDHSSHGHPMEMQALGMQTIARTCKEEGVDSGALDYFFNMAKEVVDAGGAQLGTSSLAEKFLRK